MEICLYSYLQGVQKDTDSASKPVMCESESGFGFKAFWAGFGFGFGFRPKKLYINLLIEMGCIRIRIRIQTGWIRIRIQGKRGGFGFRFGFKSEGVDSDSDSRCPDSHITVLNHIMHIIVGVPNYILRSAAPPMGYEIYCVLNKTQYMPPNQNIGGPRHITPITPITPPY